MFLEEFRGESIEDGRLAFLENRMVLVVIAVVQKGNDQIIERTERFVF